MDIKPLPQVPVLASNIDKTARNAFSESYNRINQIIKRIAVTDTGGTVSGFKNYIINGNFDIWQRGTSATNIINGTFLADRWGTYMGGSSASISRQSFTPGQTEVPGNPTFFHRTVVTSAVGANNFVDMQHHIENVALTSGKTYTLSFYAKADSSKNIAVAIGQNFGAGGSPNVGGVGSQLVALTSSWKKYSITFNVPSILGKTLGTNNDHYQYIVFYFDAGVNLTNASGLGQQSGTFDIAQVQFEEGSVATNFEYRPIEIELDLCQRYFETSFDFGGIGLVTSIYGWYSTQIPSSSNRIVVPFKTRKRVTPTITLYSPNTGAQGYISASNSSGSAADFAQSGLSLAASSRNFQFIWNTQYNGGFIAINYVLDAEL